MAIHEVEALEAEGSFGSVLNRVEAGEEIVITRQARPTARLTPIMRVSEADRARAFAALERMDRHARKMNRGPFDWEEWKAYRDEGRR